MIMRGREPAGYVQHARALSEVAKSLFISTNCYGVRAILLVGLVTDEKALYTGSTWGQAVGAGGQSWVSSALYCLFRPAEETSDVVFRAVCPPYVRSWFWLCTSKAQTHLIRHSNHL